MGQVIAILARIKRPIAVRRLNKIEGRQALPSTDTCTHISTLTPYLTTIGGPYATTTGGPYATTTGDPYATTTDPYATNSPPNPQPATNTIVSSTTLSDHSLTKYSISTASASSALANHSTASATLSSSLLTDSSTPDPSQRHDYMIPLIVVACISGVFILITAIIFIIRKIRPVQMGEARSTMFGTHIPQPMPMIGGSPDEQQSSPSEKVDRSLSGPVATRHYADQQPSSILFPQGRQQTNLLYAGEINSLVASRPRVMDQLSRRGSRIAPAERSMETEQPRVRLHEQMQHSSGQVGHLQRQVAQADGIQGLSDGEPPAYVPE